MSATGGPTSVLIADGHPVFRELVRRACEATPPLEVSAEVGDADEALTWWERRPPGQPDLVALDLELPGADGLDLARRLIADAPGVAILALAETVGDRLVLE
ncbi:MAG: response regulator transcription factor, partial [Actinomycetota bacterium]|nr:response regulator transcription factor [Actinomycetota bacterium]